MTNLSSPTNARAGLSRSAVEGAAFLTEMKDEYKAATPTTRPFFINSSRIIIDCLMEGLNSDVKLNEDQCRFVRGAIRAIADGINSDRDLSELAYSLPIVTLAGYLNQCRG